VRFIQERLVTGGFSTARLLKRWAGLGAAAAVIALAIASSLAWLAPLPGGDPMYQYVVDSFKHSQSNGGVVDLAASRGSTIGAWLKGRINPPVPIQEISSSTIVLGGVRLDKLGEQNVAVLVYRVGATEIDLFEWSDAQVHPSEPMIDQIGAYTVAYWSSDGTHFWAVTATHDKSVVDLRDVVQRLTAPATTAPVTTP